MENFNSETDSNIELVRGASHIDIEKRKPSHICPICGEKIRMKKNLNRHLKIHTDEKPYVCEECGKKFGRKHDCIRHMKIHNKPFKCDNCKKTFVVKEDLDNHIKIHSDGKFYVCEVCEKRLKRKDNYSRHLKSHEIDRKIYPCELCPARFSRKSDFLKHVRQSHPISNKRKEQASAFPEKAKRNKKRALGIFSTAEFIPTDETRFDMKLFFEEVRPALQLELEEEVGESACKWYVTLNVEMDRNTNDGEEELITPHFRSYCMVDLTTQYISQHINEAYEKIERSFEEFIHRGSGWSLEKILNMEVHMALYKPLSR